MSEFIQSSCARKNVKLRTLSFAAAIMATWSAGCSDGPNTSNPLGGYGDYSSGTTDSTGTLPSGTITFSSDSTVTTDAMWGDDNAKLSVSHVGNLQAFIAWSIGAAVDGIPCTTAQMSNTDSTVLELTCSLPPGNASKPKPKLAITALTYTANFTTVYVDIPGGTLQVPVKECAPPSPPSSGVALPQLCRVDPGSTADVGKPYEGVFTGRTIVDESSSYGGLMVAGDGAYLSGFEYAGDCSAGKLIPTEGSWTYDGYAFTTKDGISASGNVFRASDHEGSYIPYKNVTDNHLWDNGYSVSNALAVTPASVAGTWSYSDSVTLTIVVNGDNGTITGTKGYSCALNGTISLHEPGSSKNLYDITLTASSLARSDGTSYTCNIPSDAVLKGFAAINFVNTGTNLNPVYGYALDYEAYQIDKVAVGGRLIKQ